MRRLSKTPIRDRVEMVLEADRYDREVQTRHYWVGIRGTDTNFWECENCEATVEAVEMPPREGCTG